MNKHYLMSKFKSTGTAYLLWFFFGCHYAYLGMWGVQFLYWLSLIAGFFTFGITWIWGFADLFLIPGKVNRYNARISARIEDIEKKEKDEEYQRNLTIAQAGKNQTNEENKFQTQKHSAPNPVPEISTSDEGNISDEGETSDQDDRSGEGQKSDSERNEFKKEKTKPNKLSGVLAIVVSVIIVSLLIFVFIYEPDTPILKKFTNIKEQATEKNSSQSDSRHERTIQGLLSAEDERDFDQIIEFYNLKEMKRYWDRQNPTYDDLRNAYSKSWNITSKSSNEINSITKVREKVYDVNLDFTFYQLKKQEWKTVNNTVRFVFDQNNKIIEVYGAK